MKEHPPFNADEMIKKINKENKDGILTGVEEKERLLAEEGDFKLKADFLLQTCRKENEDYIISELDQIIEKYPKLTKAIIRDINSEIKTIKEENNLKPKDLDLNPKVITLRRLKQHLSSKL